MTPPSLPPIGLALHRLCAGAAAALVLVLAVFAVSPNAHAWVHGDAGDADRAGQRDDHCAVVLFASGVSLPLDFPPLPAPDRSSSLPPPPAPDELFLASPRYLRQPERGPPADRVG